MLKTRASEELTFVVGCLRLNDDRELENSIVIDYNGNVLGEIVDLQTKFMQLDLDMEGQAAARQAYLGKQYVIE